MLRGSSLVILRFGVTGRSWLQCLAKKANPDESKIQPLEERQILDATGRRVVISTAIAQAGVTFGESCLVISASVTKGEVIDDKTRTPQLVRCVSSEQKLRQQAGRGPESRQLICRHVTFRPDDSIAGNVAAHVNARYISTNRQLYAMLKCLEACFAIAQAITTKLEDVRKQAAGMFDPPDIPCHSDKTLIVTVGK